MTFLTKQKPQPRFGWPAYDFVCAEDPQVKRKVWCILYTCPTIPTHPYYSPSQANYAQPERPELHHPSERIAQQTITV
ncbi:unnamed protein product [Periconia digitata]|uniref:Uncharacterized protein n=1 Tax=Periconia digitata TaxID=1303443 RepID=A0A9W4XXD2_9PLEO|nr:unnamed protein product [Periconia digitata]